MAKATAEKKPLHKSLTVQSGVALAVLILARVLLPYAGLEVSDELFQGLLALCVGAGTVGLRRALPIVILCLLPLGIVQCTHTCKKATIEITNHPELTSPPAGTISVKCDGDEKVKLTAASIKK